MIKKIKKLFDYVEGLIKIKIDVVSFNLFCFMVCNF